MKRDRLLRRDRLIVPLAARSLTEALSMLLDCLDRTGAIKDRPALEKGLASSRDQTVVTIAPHVALPHYRTDAVHQLAVALGVAHSPLAVPGTGAGPRIIALVLAPTNAATAYLRAVSALARAFRHQHVIEQLLAATSPAGALDIPELAELEVPPRIAIGDIMSRENLATTPDAAARDAIDIMNRYHARALPVVGEKGEVLGIVSESDVMRGMLTGAPRRRTAKSAAAVVPPLTVRDIMTRSVMCITEDTPLEEAAQLMISKEVEQFPVVSEGRLVGLITRADILRKLYER